VSQQSSANTNQPECPLVHALINKLSAVIGNCDLMLENTPEDSPQLARIKLIRDTAKSIVAELAEYQCDLIRRRVEKTRKASAS
jgi:hypothetical protein